MDFEFRKGNGRVWGRNERFEEVWEKWGFGGLIRNFIVGMLRKF